MELENVKFLKEEDDSQAREEEQKMNKSIQYYKDTMTLIKVKMTKADALIRQYNDKMKECDILNQELTSMRNEKQDILNRHNLTMEKVTRLELSNINNEQSTIKYKDLSKKQKIKLDENEQHINQLLFKIKDIENQNSVLEDTIKNLQHNIKSAKATAKIVEKKIGAHLKHESCQTINIEKQSISINTENRQMSDKDTVTDECKVIETEPFPIYCTKCKVHISPTPIEQILKIMSSEPPLLSEYISPPNSPKLNKSHEDYEPIKPNIIINKKETSEELDTPRLDNKECLSSLQDSEKLNYCSFMEIDKLTRKINKLENLIKKSNKVKKEKRKCQQNCCSSKNIKFVVQLPNEEKFYEYRKREKRKMKLIKRLNNKNINIENRKSSLGNKWHVETCEEPKMKKIVNKLRKKDLSETKKLASQEKQIDLFDCPEVIISKERYNDNSISSCISEETILPSTFSDMFSKTTPEKLSETNVNIGEKSTIIDINVDKFEMEHENSFCNLTTSQVVECKNIYQNLATMPSNEIHLIENEIAKINTVNDSNNLHKTLINTEDAEQMITISDNSIDENKISVQTFNDVFNINETVFTQYNKIHADQHYNEINNRLTIKDSTESEYFSEMANAKLIESACQDSMEKENKENKKIQNNNFETTNFENEKIFISNNDSIQEHNLYQESNSEYNTKECLPASDTKVLNKQIEGINKNSSSLDENSIKNNIQQDNRKNINLQSDKTEENIEISQLFFMKPEAYEKNRAVVDPNVHSIVKNIASNEIHKDTTFLEENSIVNQEINNIKDNIVISSDESSESRFFSSSGIKRLKTNTSGNVFFSDESSEGRITEKSTTVKRKKLNENAKIRQKASANRKKLLSKIRNIKRTSKKSIISNKLDNNKSLIKDKPLDALIPLNPSIDNQPLWSIPSSKLSLESSTNSSVKVIENSLIEDIPLKKQRIAHIPKSTYNSNSIKPSISLTKRVRKMKSNPKKQMEQSGDKVSSIIEEFNKSCKERTKISQSLEDIKPDLLESISFDATHIANTDGTTTYKHLNIGEDTNLIDIKNFNKIHDITNNTEFSLNNLPKANKIIPTVVDNCDENINLTEENKPSDTKNMIKNTKNKKKITNNVQDKNPVRKLRTRQVVINYSPKGKKLKTNNMEIIPKIDETNSCLHETTIVSCLNDYISNLTDSSKIQRNRIHFITLRKTVPIIEEQIKLLMENEQWTTEVNSKVTKTLADLSNLKIVAYVLIEYAASKTLNDEDFDKSHTPPAPIMTRSEQKLVTVILSIDKIKPEFYNFIQAGIQYKLFRLGNPQDVQIVERLFRILVVLNKIRKDREKVRIFCCDALYCLNLRAINIIYVALTCWPEVFPKHDSNNDIIVKTIVHIVMTLKVNNPYPKLNSLRKLLSAYYEYPNSGYTTNVFKDDLLKMLQENVPGINTAVLLVCKKLGPIWSSENVVVGLKQIIVTQAHPSLYNALTLLGNILRPYQTLEQNNVVDQIIDQLCDVLASNTGSDDVQEGVVSCLLSISKFKYKQIACSVMKWQSNKDMCPTTKEKLYSFFKQYDAKWWWKFIQVNFPLPK